MKNYSGESFLNKLYKDLHMSDVVMHTASASDNPSQKINKYMERLERIHDNKKENIKNYIMNLYHKKYIIKGENLTEYRNSQTEEIRRQIIESQIKTFDMWINYLTDEEAKYPMWAKYWAFQGMLKIGTYDEATDTYKKRNKKTTSPFIEANPEVIAKCIDLIVKQVNKELDDVNVGEEELKKLVETGSFQKLYTTLLKKQKKIQYKKSGFEGKWIKYNHGNKDEAIKLYNSLQGYATAWCTAGSEQTAINQICGGNGYIGGDFYVYYTLNENNEYKIPRIAIRMDETTNIGEIRGVADASQNIEDGMETIVEEKLNTFDFLSDTDKQEYLNVINDSKVLTKLNRKTANNEELTYEEYIFIYEIERKITGFGFQNDSRIEKIRRTNLIKDKDIATKFLSINGILLKYVSEELRNNIEIVKLAISQNVFALEFASEELRNNIEVIKFAVSQTCFALQFASEELRNNIEVVKLAISQDGITLKYASEELRNNIEVVKLAVSKSEYAFRFASEELRNNIEVVKLAVSQDGCALNFASEELRNNIEVVKLAVSQDGRALEFANEELQKSKYFQTLAEKCKEKTNRKLR